MAPSNFITRIRRLGLASITALFAGGTILILVALNALLGPITNPDIESVPMTPMLSDSERMFRFFADRSRYFWCNIIASGAVLIWYGLIQAYIHPSGCRCAHETRREAQVNEGSHFDSIGRRTTLLGLRYLFPVLCLAAWAGYCFGIIDITAQTNGTIDQGVLKLSFLPPLATDTAFSGPWAIIPDGEVQDKYFVDGLEYESGELGPVGTIMVGTLDCRSAVDSLRFDIGCLMGREIVMVANRTEDKGSFNMTKDHPGWMRTQTSGSYWFSHDEERIPAVVDYRIVEPGKVQMQWARGGSWLDDDGPESTPVFRRVSFTIRYAVAIVTRDVMSWGRDTCATAYDVDILSIDSNPPATENANGSLPYVEKWTDIMLSSKNSNGYTESNAFLRAVMAGWAAPTPSTTHGPQMGFIEDDNMPFGPEQTPVLDMPGVDRRGFPYYTGLRSGIYRGCDREAACIFLIVGTLAILVGRARLQCGPCDSGVAIGEAGYMALGGDEKTKEDDSLLDTGCDEETD